MKRTSIILCSLLLIAGAPLYAQSGKSKQPAAPAKTALRFRTTWGIFLSDTLPRPEVLKLLDSALVVRDQQNHTFPVVSFDFTYEKAEPYLNDTTGQPGIYKDFVGDSFSANKLSPLWANRLKEVLQKGEILYFDNIVIKYTGDKYYKVPDLKFVVR
ncbi:hypothetical protein F0L74_26175 [Chitinophaga agrisoli]|uniref:Uncharacterized protein n=1 Tax=Chitinophaga agrisoli TaxID=2607653 RepID=A0A5B2VN00_9BACT|nr:hypothetical protein [Chitinophaga agrisoli]KAA2239682.1 hypothetical protein F0L74_26175 [Chitinophaga agrisoli]